MSKNHHRHVPPSLITMRSRDQKDRRQKRMPQHQRSSVEVDIESLLLIENHCNGCTKGERCCCASYEVCVTAAEVRRIIKVMPEVAKLCPHLMIDGGFDNVFEEEEPGLFSIDTTEDGLCILAYWSHHRINCSLHTVALSLGLPLAQVKPKVCLLWPLHFSEGEEVLAIINDAFQFSCNVRRKPGSLNVSLGFIEAIEHVYGEGCGIQVELAAQKGDRRTLLITRQ